MLSARELHTIPHGAVVHFNVQCPPEGLTINACGYAGKTILYIKTTRSPNEKEITIEKDKCHNKYIECSTTKRRRQASEDKIYVHVGIEGAGNNNVYDLRVSTGDSSTPQGKKNGNNIKCKLGYYNTLIDNNYNNTGAKMCTF